MREYKIRGKIYKIRYNDFSGELTPIIFILFFQILQKSFYKTL